MEMWRQKLVKIKGKKKFLVGLINSTTNDEEEQRGDDGISKVPHSRFSRPI